MAKSNYLGNAINDHILGGPDFARPGVVYIALFTAAPNPAGGGTEVAGGSYARQAVTNDAANWPAAVTRSKSNASLITFPQATAAWGTITHVALFDALSGGNLLRYQALTDPITIQNGSQFSFPVGSLVFTEN